MNFSRIGLLFVLILIIIGCSPKYNISVNQKNTNQNQEANLVFENFVAQQIVVGISAGYSINGVTQWQSTAGYLDKINDKLFELNTVLRIASIAKSMTAIAVMQLVEQELIDLDAPIQTYIADYPKQANTQITARHLLSHTSGIAGYKNGYEAETTAPYPTLFDAVNVFKNRALLFEPGEKYSYTTYGYTVLGLLIEQVSGVTFENYMEQNIWSKAGMKLTGIDQFRQPLPDQSLLYHRKKKIKKGKENNLSNRIPGGGFYSTLGDVLKFGEAVVNHTLVKEKTLDLMRQHHSLEKQNNAYGFGWFLYNPKPNEGALIGHTGEQTGASSQLFIVPHTKTIVVALSNTSGSSPEVSALAGNLLAISQKQLK